MSSEFIGIDHFFISVSNLGRSEPFYDTVMKILDFRKTRIDGDAHVQYYNRLFGYVLRPARHRIAHDAYAPGWHQLCFRDETPEAVRTLGTKLREAGIKPRAAAAPGVRAGLSCNFSSGSGRASGWRSPITGSNVGSGTTTGTKSEDRDQQEET